MLYLIPVWWLAIQWPCLGTGSFLHSNLAHKPVWGGAQGWLGCHALSWLPLRLQWSRARWRHSCRILPCRGISPALSGHTWLPGEEEWHHSTVVVSGGEGGKINDWVWLHAALACRGMSCVLWAGMWRGLLHVWKPYSLLLIPFTMVARRRRLGKVEHRSTYITRDVA